MRAGVASAAVRRLRAEDHTQDPGGRCSRPEGMTDFDYDWLVIGSGFGGSVSALRLAEKGYSVAVLECGRRFRDEDFANEHRGLPPLQLDPAAGHARDPAAQHLQGRLRVVGLRGRRRQPRIRQHAVPSASGFYENPQWSELADWERELAPFYGEAERMLGVTDYDRDGVADVLLREYGESIGVDARPTSARRSACSWASRARRCRIPTSAARALSAPAARAAAAA